MNKIYIKLSLLLVLGIVSINQAHATCTLTGFTARILTVPSGIHMYFRSSHSANFHYRGFSNDPEIAATMFQANKGKSKILVRSDADECPTISGPGEYFIGIIDIVGLGY